MGTEWLFFAVPKKLPKLSTSTQSLSVGSFKTFILVLVSGLCASEKSGSAALGTQWFINEKMEIVRGAQTFSYDRIIYQEQNDVTLVNGNH